MNAENQGMGQIQQENNKVEKEEKTLKITDEITTYLDGAGTWGKFLAILGFVCVGLIVVGGFIMCIVLAFIPGELGDMPFPPFLFGLFYLIIGAIYLLPILYLYRFSTGIKTALMLKNQEQFTKAFFNLKALYRFIGIFTVVIFVLYLLVLAIMIFAGLFAGLTSFVGMQA